MMDFFFSTEGLLSSEKFKYLNGREPLSLDLKTSNPISVPLTDFNTPCDTDNRATHMEVTKCVSVKSDFYKCLCERQKDSNPIFKDSPSQVNLVFLLRYLCRTAFHFFHVAHFIFERKMKFIKGLC